MIMIGDAQKIVEIEGRTFQITKYSAVTGLIIAKLIISKILPMLQSLLPVISTAMSGDEGAKESVMAELEQHFDFESIARALDLVTEQDMTYIVEKSLMSCSEILGAGPAQVLNPNKTYGVPNVEYDVVLVLRLVCEAVLLGCGGFFEGDRLTSVMSPVFSSLPQSQ